MRRVSVSFPLCRKRAYGRRTPGVLLLLLLFFCLGGVFSPPLSGEEREAALYARVENILNGYTSFSWGKDCIVWMVAYPEKLIDPWVQLRALEEGFSSEEAGAYRSSFRRDLRMAETQPLLITLYVFGDHSLELMPFSEHIALVNASGARIPPLSYAEELDVPLAGIVQGFVFFPPQEDAFFIELEGVAPGGPKRFAFSGMGDAEEPREEFSGEEEVIVVRLPEKNADRTPEAESSEGTPGTPSPALSPTKTPSPTPKPEDPDQPPAYLVLPPREAEPPAAKVPERPEEPAVPEPSQKPEPSPEAAEKKEPSLSPVPETEEKSLPYPINRVRRVEAFLNAWKEGRTEQMYAMLSEKSQKSISPKAFEKAALEDQFRFALKNPYTLKWEGEDTVKVVAPQKMLVMRVLRSRTLHLVLEKGAWYVAW